ncbi:MAG: spore coat associated protein CotJA [Lachnospiraceae bacterium]|nr:spore coat associated protein CotJA [Lachnospiraceae bacterium]
MNQHNYNRYQQTNSMPASYNNQPACNQELAMAYVPFQEFRNLYETDRGFRQGTIFQELYKPFQGYLYKGGRS